MKHAVSGSTRATLPVGPKDLRSGNLAAVLRVVDRSAPVAQSEIVSATQLKKPTVASLVSELLSLGWIRIAGEVPSAGGRPSQLLAPAPDRGLLLALRIGLHATSVLVVDTACEQRATRVEAIDAAEMSPAEVAGYLSEMVADSLHASDLALPVLGVSLALPGIVNSAGTLAYAPGLPWRDVDFAAHLRNRLTDLGAAEIPILVQNEAHFAALAERRWGHTGDTDNFVYLLGEAGVGGGVVIDGRLFRGQHGAGGEIGHLSVDVNGPPCHCGKSGCWATFISEDVVVRRVKQKLAQGWPSILVEHGNRLTSLQIVDAARNGDELAREEIARLRRYLLIGIANLAVAYDPEIIVVAGFLKYAFEDDFVSLMQELSAWLMYRDLKLCASVFDRDGSLWGGATAVYAHLTEATRLR